MGEENSIEKLLERLSKLPSYKPSNNRLVHAYCTELGLELPKEARGYHESCYYCLDKTTCRDNANFLESRL